jgi:hypothetical protein
MSTTILSDEVCQWFISIIRSRNCLPFTGHLCSRCLFFGEIRDAYLSSFLCCVVGVFLFSLSSFRFLSTHCCLCLEHTLSLVSWAHSVARVLSTQCCLCLENAVLHVSWAHIIASVLSSVACVLSTVSPMSWAHNVVCVLSTYCCLCLEHTMLHVSCA